MSLSCAQQSGLSGGEKDIEPPKIDSERTFPKNGSTNFNSNQIAISFNEYIRLTSPNQNIVVTPSLNSKPVYELKGRKVIINFSEPLDSNTTYTINFGNSISDLTEGNKLLNYSYVFSTGAVLDSLTLEGVVHHAFHKTASEDMLVGLYKSIEDSVGLKNKPYYFTKTRNDGSFKFNNLKEGNYTLIAFEDENSNLKYDRFTESISFLDSTIEVNNDTLQAQHRLSIFKEEQLKNWIVSKKYKHPGSVTLILNKKAETIDLKLLNNSFSDGEISKRVVYSDSLHFWVKNIDSVENIQLVTTIDTNIIDTLHIRIKKPKKIKDTTLRFKTNMAKNLAYFEPIRLTFKTPIEEINTEHILLFNEDSVIIPFEATFINNEMNINAKFKEDMNYDLYLYPNSIKDIYNKVTDSAHLIFSIIPTNEYGSIILHYEKGIDHQQIIQLIQKGKVLEEYIIDSKTTTIEFKHLSPGDYKLKAINDANNNNRWDTGDYLLKTQPELVKLFEDKINLKAGWDLDLTWKN